MFTLTLTGAEATGNGYIAIWENGEGVTRVSFEPEKPVDSEMEYVAKVTKLETFASLHFGGIGKRGAEITFTDGGAVTKVKFV
jgi:hypothetical protein